MNSCASCHWTNPEGSRFCNRCGTRLDADHNALTQRLGSPAAIAAGVPLPSSSEAQAASPESPAAAPPAPAPGTTSASAAGSKPIAATAGAPAPSRQLGAAATKKTAPDASTVSLAHIGVRSSKATWAIVAVGGALLLGAGLAAGLVLGRPGAHAPEPRAQAELIDELPTPATSPVSPAAATSGESAAPLGLEPPEARRGAPRRSSTTAARTLVDTVAPSRSSATTAPRPAAPSAASRPTKTRLPRERASGGAVAELPPADTSETPSSRPPSEESSTPPPWTSEPAGPAAASSPMPAAEEDPAGDEHDIEMQMYASRVRSVIRQYYRPRAQTCFERALRNDPELRGTVMVGFTIGGNGQVRGARALSNSTGHDEIGSCVVHIVNTWRLPEPPDGEDLQIEMPFSR